MRPSLVFSTLLCFTKLMDADHRPVAKSCCTRWSNINIPPRRIVSYTIQSEGICTIRAIMIHTKGRKRLCWDPSSEKAQEAILKVDKEREMIASQEKGHNENTTTRDTTTSDTTPSAYATSKKAPQKKHSRRHRKKKKLWKCV